MKVLPLLWDGQRAGEIRVEQEGLYLRFTLRADLPEGIWCVWLVGEAGELRLGIPEPENGESSLCRRMSLRAAAPLGRLLRGEVRLPGGQTEDWACVSCPSLAVRSPWLRQALERCGAAMTRREGAHLFLALPYGEKEPFPLVFLFCFARICRICGREYAVFAFDGEEQPVIPRKTEKFL